MSDLTTWQRRWWGIGDTLNAATDELAKVRVELTKWQRRYETVSADLIAARAENVTLRTALDELNADTEQMFNDAGQEGIEKAKTHRIERQMAYIRRMKRAGK